MRLLVALIALSGATGCAVSDVRARKAAMDAGYINVKPGGIDILACGEDEIVGRRFEALTHEGERVAGVVCCGIFKSCTLRF